MLLQLPARPRWWNSENVSPFCNLAQSHAPTSEREGAELEDPHFSEISISPAAEALHNFGEVSAAALVHLLIFWQALLSTIAAGLSRDRSSAYFSPLEPWLTWLPD